jgi:glycerophosphoryl diester phosphodiesterase
MKFKKLKILGIVVLSIISFMVVINLIPPKKSVDNNPFIVGDKLPLLAAHRGGGANAPENTMLAYKTAVYENQADVIETDVCLTKDGHLVFIHDETLDDRSDVDMIKKGVLDDGKDDNYIINYDLDELKQFNFGYKYEDENDKYPYKNLVSQYDFNSMERKQILDEYDLQIVELSELFDEFYETKPNLKFIIEIKNSGENGFKAARIMNEVLDEYPHYRENTVIRTFHSEVEEKVKEYGLLRGASLKTAAIFVVTQTLGVNLFYNQDFACLQIPRDFGFDVTEDIEINFWLNKKKYIKRAHRRNIAVQYWTINDEDEMRELIELGCDCIMTDNPKLLREVLNSYKK